jgi:ribosomal protein S18 acetylase RimI-like enzyme
VLGEYFKSQRSVEIVRSELDTKRFTWRVGRCVVSTNSEVSDFEILSKIDESDHEIIVLRFPSSRTGLSHSLSTSVPNAFLADKLLYFVKELRVSTGERDLGHQRDIRVATIDDAGAIKGIAESAFRDYSSHYSANSRIPKGKILEGYADWAVRQLRDSSVVLVGVNENGVVDGFLSLQINNGIGEIVLNAVREQAQGMGIYKSLLEHAQEYAINEKCTKIVTSTQATNLKVIHIWESNGFEENLMIDTWHINR